MFADADFATTIFVRTVEILIRWYQTSPYTLVLAIYAVMSLITYAVYAHDKKCAREGRWRTSESTLHFLELLGGWPGALLAQRRLRHKCRKLSYQIVYWFIVLCNLAALVWFHRTGLLP